MSNSKKIKLNKIFCGFILCLSVFFSAIMLGFNTSKEVVLAANPTGYIYEDVSSDLIGSDYNFYTSATINDKPVSPSNWSVVEDGVNTDDNDDNKKYLNGIVDISSSKFNEEEFKTSRPVNIADDDQGNSDEDSNEAKAFNKCLMINAHNNEAIALGYKSKSISLEANSFYEISVDVYTHQSTYEARASIFIEGLIDENNSTEEEYVDDVYFKAINTQESLQTYKFFIHTNSAKTINLQLWLGEDKSHPVKGAVFFKETNIMRYSEDLYKYLTKDYPTNTNDDPTSKTKLINLLDTHTTPFENNSFETKVGERNWKILANSTSDLEAQYHDFVPVATYNKTINDTTIKAPGSNCSPDNEKALFMYNKNDAYQGIESQPFEVKQHGYYKLSFWAKSDCDTGNGATVKLVDKSENPISSSKLTLAKTTTTNKFRNDWTEYNFYIYGDAHQDKDVAVQIWLGTQEDDGKTSGYVFVDDFRLYQIDYTQFSNNSSSSNSTTMNFNTEATRFSIQNGEFDTTYNDETAYPLTPSTWKHTSTPNKANIYSGVISINPDNFNANKSNYYNNLKVNCPPQIEGKDLENNVLMIGSEQVTNSQSYKSNDLSLSASSYYKVSMYVSTQYTNPKSKNIGGRVTLSTTDYVIFDQFNIYYSDNNWHKLEYYIKTGTQALTANLELKFEKSTGHIFFDDVRFETISETTFNNPAKLTTSDPNPKKVDLTHENFTNNTFGKTFELTETPNNWTANENEAHRYGITEINGSVINNIDASPSNNKYALYIDSPNPTHFTFTSKTTTTLSSSKYYKITVNVLTKNISGNEENPGATITLKENTTIGLNGIDTNGQWKQCTIYVCPNEEISTNIILALGTSENLTAGEVLFDNLVITEIDEETYLDEIIYADEDYTSKHINYVKPEEDTDTEDDKAEKEPINWWILVPSLVTGLAIIIAVVGYYVRKLSFGRKPKIKTKYDRRKTLDKDISKREKIALRKQIIDELNAELLAIDKEIEEYNTLAQNQLNEIKKKIIEEQEEIKRKKIELEIKKKEATAEREKQLKQDPTLLQNAKAEKEFVAFISKLDKQELALQKQLTQKDVKLASVSTEVERSSKLDKFNERKEFIRNEIAKIELEINEIMKEEDEMWSEYKQAKLEAKKRKQEYTSQKKAEEEASKTSSEEKSEKKKKSKKETLKEKSVKTKTEKPAKEKKVKKVKETPEKVETTEETTTPIENTLEEEKVEKQTEKEVSEKTEDNKSEE
ncbi:MAG: hypothetical protein E7345_04440 [Clostridiales bacterium]|nr:hypothetical protein [Clostridiales bacterium]